MYLLQMPSFPFSFIEIGSISDSFIALKMENISKRPISMLSIKKSNVTILHKDVEMTEFGNGIYLQSNTWQGEAKRS